ncbi:MULTISPECIES: ABC transporter ATP-binding protein [Roseobacteraceae]|jgi:NitT/TauT family transport system ATP-binding protein|uniref:Aliphatic sulfonates import ATP-binding protein SsuB n=1 Tax=Pseudosulfitobacter pseudonitzschiae TaxID=1402135 RepID=A0A221K7F4_9RHOB|nr:MULTISPECIES: ABC transporter ATP-binding protein [Roseobacteraceae]ASM74905.1 aliphatic sulfonates import ATP-binding protein SsuB [Pseudosulfitobacter pseudonitzschiae]
MTVTPAPVDGSALIDMRGVDKQFGNGTVAVRDMSLTIGQGEFVSFLGPSGCGKSTALKMISGLLSVSAGSITVNGHRPGQSSDGSDIGYVFQEATLMPWATVYDNVYLPLKLQGIGKVEGRARVEEALSMVGLANFAKSYPRELSGGMKMRVSIARAMVTKPKLLLMDEPFAALDEMSRTKLNDEVLSLWQSLGLTVIFVTHSVFESVYLSSRVVVMAARPGRVVHDIALTGGYPRNSAYRMSPEYAESCRTVSKALEGTMENVALNH